MPSSSRGLEPQHERCVQVVGMDEFCKIKFLGNNNRIFSMSLLARIDPKTMNMDMGDGNFVVINAREV